MVAARSHARSVTSGFMAVQPLYGVPPRTVLPLVKGEDVSVEFVYKPMVLDNQGDPVLVDGEPQFVEDDFPEGSILTLVIEPSVSGLAQIDGSRASVSIDHTAVDKIRAGSLWRLILSVNGLDRVLINGRTTRSDG